MSDREPKRTDDSAATAIDDALLEHLKSLARLEIDPEESAVIERDLNDILGYFALLSDLDTDGVEPLTRPIAVTDAMREDEIEEPLPRDRVAELALEMEEGMIRVPRTVDEGN